jgi:histidyl-tRNA synthetase
MFRYERPQAGRFRQFHQLDVEALGDDHPSLDAEVIVMVVELFQRLDLAQRLQVEINSLGDENPECRPRYRTELVRYLRENASRLCEECRERTERDPLRVLDCKRPECRPVLDRAPALAGFLCQPCSLHFARTREYLEAMGVRYVVSPRLVRGLDYYVRTTFELTTTELGAQNAVAGGGRYDGLIKLLGGPPDPGIGFAVGVDRVVQLLPETGSETWE